MNWNSVPKDVIAQQDRDPCGAASLSEAHSFIGRAEIAERVDEIKAKAERLELRASQADTANHIDEWLKSPGLQPPRSRSMQDMKASAEKLRAEADYAEQIARSATDGQKRELYERLAVHFRQLAGDIEKAMADRRE